MTKCASLRFTNYNITQPLHLLNMRWAFWRSGSDEAGPSTPPVEPVKEAPKLTRFEATLIDEEKVQAAQYPTFKEVPTCMTLL